MSFQYKYCWMFELLMGVFFLVAVSTARSEEVTLRISGGGLGLEGDSARALLVLKNPIPVGGIQLDLDDVGDPLRVEQSARSSDRLGDFHIRHRELGDGSARVVIYPQMGRGESMPLIAPGESTLLELSFSIQSQASPDSVPLTIGGLIVADSSGRQVDAVSENRVLFPTGIAYDGSIPPERHTLEKNYPNPINAGTVIPFALTSRLSVDLRILDVRGHTIRVLKHGEMEPGYHTAHWDGRNEAGRAVPSGIYFYRLRTRWSSAYGKMLLLK